MRAKGKYCKLLAVTAAVALLVMTAGCGSDSTGAGGSTKTVKVKIGVGAPLTSGVVAFGEGVQRGVELAAAQANASERAKAAGIEFVVVAGDDAGDPKTGVTVANSLASDRSVIGVVGHVNSGVSIPASKVYSDANIVMIAPSSTDPALTLQGLDNVFRVCTIDTVQGSFAGEVAAKDLGFKTAYVVDDSTQYGAGLSKYFAEQFAADGGTVVGQDKTSEKDTDFGSLVVKIKKADPDAIYYGGLYNAGALLSKQLKEAGVDVPVFGGDGFYDAQYIKLAGGSNAEGDYSTSIGLPLSQMPKGQEFKSAFEDKFPGKQIAAYDAYGYDAANIIIEATLKAAEDLGASKVTTVDGKKAIIAGVHATDLEGITGKLAFDDKGDTLNKAITLYQVKDGVWTPVVLK